MNEPNHQVTLQRILGGRFTKLTIGGLYYTTTVTLTRAQFQALVTAITTDTQPHENTRNIPTVGL